MKKKFPRPFRDNETTPDDIAVTPKPPVQNLEVPSSSGGIDGVPATTAVRKSMRGLRPGDPIPGAYEVSGRARGEIPSWRQPDNSTDDDNNNNNNNNNDDGPEDVSANNHVSANSGDSPSSAPTSGAASDPNLEIKSSFVTHKCIVLVAASLLLLIAVGIGVAFILTNEDRDPPELIGKTTSCDYQQIVAQPDIQ
jgi:hypothetical protein